MTAYWRHPLILLPVAAAAIAALVVPTSTSAAAWNDTEWTHGSLMGTSSYDCGVDTGYAAESEARFLRGALLGLDLDGIAALNGVNLQIGGAGDVSYTPAAAADLGSTAPVHTRADALSVSALTLGILDLSPLQVGLPVGSLGAVNQYAQVSGYGAAAAAAGLVSNSGAVLVSGSTPDDQLPEPARLSLGGLLTPVPGVETVDLGIGAVASSAQLDWCAALASSIWGVGATNGVVRDYGIASLDVEMESSLLAGLSGEVTGSVVPALETELATLLGTDGLISTLFTNALGPLVTGLSLGAATGEVSLTALDLSTVTALLDDELAGDGVSLDLGSGVVTIDLEHFVGSLNDRDPNTELVLNADVVNAIVASTTGLIATWRVAVFDAIQSAVEAATLTIDLNVVVSAPPVLIFPATDVLSVNLSAVATIGDILDGSLTLGVGVTALSGSGLLDTILNAILGTTLGALTTLILGLQTSLVTPIVGVVTTTVGNALGGVENDLLALTSAVVNALSGVIAALPSVLSLMVNVQPDQVGAPPGTSFVPAAGHSSAEYAVSALRLGLAYALAPGGVAAVDLGTSTVGVITAP